MLPEFKTAIPGPVSKRLAAQLSLVECPEVTYLGSEFPVFWRSALGTNIYDVDGNRFLDLNSAFGVMSFGHAHPSIAKSIADQSVKLVHGMGDVHPPEGKVMFMNALKAILPPGLDQMILSCNGSDACETAIKTTQIFTGRPGIVAFEGSYHGLGYGALDLTHREHFRAPFESRLSPFTHFLPFPSDRVSGEEALHKLAVLLDEECDLIGGVIVEPIQGRGGVIVPPDGFLKNLRLICSERGLVLIYDEIYTGFARTGSMFACVAEPGIVPDILCLGKVIGGGLPLSVCVGSAEVMTAWGRSPGEAVHTSTFLGNPLACAAGLAVLNLLSAADWCLQVNRLGALLIGGLRDRIGGLPWVKDIRGRGLMIGIELSSPPGFEGSKPAVDIMNRALQRGLIVLPCGQSGQVLCLAPPFVISEQELNYSINVIADLIIDLGQLQSV